MQFTVTLSNSTLNSPIQSISYNFSDGTSHVGGTPATHIYNRVANFDVSVTVALVDGRSATSSIVLQVIP